MKITLKKKNKEILTYTFISIVTLFFIACILWGLIILTPLQLKSSNQCEKVCEDYDDYSINFQSYPLRNINAKCYCKTIINLENITKSGGNN